MIRQRKLHQILGRWRVVRLVERGWLAPNRFGGRIYFSAEDVRRALKRLQREGYLLAPPWRPAPARPRQSRFAAWDRDPELEALAASLPQDLFGE